MKLKLTFPETLEIILTEHSGISMTVQYEHSGVRGDSTWLHQMQGFSPCLEDGHEWGGQLAGLSQKVRPALALL